MIIENLTTLKINQLTQAQYEAALAAGTVNENELYMTEIEGDVIEEIQLNGTPISPTSGVVNIDITDFVQNAIKNSVKIKVTDDGNGNITIS